MTDGDTLRTRIADIVDAQKPILNYRHCEMVADVLIRELGWRQEWSVAFDQAKRGHTIDLCGDCDGPMIVGHDQARVWRDVLNDDPINARNAEIVDRHVTAWRKATDD